MGSIYVLKMPSLRTQVFAPCSSDGGPGTHLNKTETLFFSFFYDTQYDIKTFGKKVDMNFEYFYTKIKKTFFS